MNCIVGVKNGLSVLLYSIKDLKLHTKNRYQGYKTAVNTKGSKILGNYQGFKTSNKNIRDYQGFKTADNYQGLKIAGNYQEF